MDRPGDDAIRDPAVHAVSLRCDPCPWGPGWRPECSCGWRGRWHDHRPDAVLEGALHWTQPDAGAGQ